ncbi:MAG: TM0106 family RecB-like putative nuclease [Nisaea sp.]|uniref:TM0106 family RecB-like putative nuclease n=1 Tax=Nisaea sp. TaxID=2024842 RepID=UPI001B0FC63C|nr:TM0106 family RecB-like putative nuclease [Nisaea sp.]MBO6560251.1 TM0106 family RecB-like putative nuclease [Nisaea sp.]
MKFECKALHLSASDLVGHTNCDHLTSLDVQVATGTLKKPDHYDPLLALLRERGQLHESAYIDHLKQQGLTITSIEGVGITDSDVEATLAAMNRGEEIIVQAALRDGRWSGRADILRKVPSPSDLGEFSYEVIDTKLARETKGGTVLQLCLYGDLLTQMQGRPPEKIYVVSPWSDFEPQEFRYNDYAAYYRRVKAAAEVSVDSADAEHSYPDPKSHCDFCRWQRRCDQRRRNDDHLCLVAGISKNQINEFQANGFDTTRKLAEMSLPLPFKPQRGAVTSFERVQAQAAIQVAGRDSGELRFEYLTIQPGFGLAALPAPSDGDVFFDIESDQFVGEHGLEYLFGYAFSESDGTPAYIADWAFDRESEKSIFERFVDFVTARRARFPDMHIYHFGGYETGALKRLMGRYATREDEVDALLRGVVFVDLLSITRNAIRASVESYSLKQLEAFCGYERETTLQEANSALSKLSAALELNDVPSIEEDTKDTVAAYNKDDCIAAWRLRDWLEQRRTEKLAAGADIPRPEPGQDSPNEELSERQQHIQELIGRLTASVPVDSEERSEEQQALWILAYILDWHRRENKAVWWEKYRLQDLTADELLDEKAGLGRLEFVSQVDETKTGIPTHRYRFPPQDTDIRGDENLHDVGGAKLGKATAISPDDLTVDIKKSRATADVHPEGVFSHLFIDPKEQAASLLRLGEYVAEHGILGHGLYKSARDMLLRTPMNLRGAAFQEDGESTLEAAIRLTTLMNGGVLPVQGPPGTGKSFTGARMVCQLVKLGKRVGITANSHKVIRNLIDKVIEAALEMGLEISCIQKPEQGNTEGATDHLSFARSNDDVLRALSSGDAQVAGATHFFWAREDAFETVDVLVIDEAGQMSLANALAVSQAAPTVVMLGDPQQLDQPTQGTHPDGTGVSALDHLLAGRQTIGPDQGLFLETTYRLHPDICDFNSELFYEGKLTSKEGCEQQCVEATGYVRGAGLRFLPVEHNGNASVSTEEAEVVQSLVEHIIGTGATWTDRDGSVKPVTFDDILVIAPYNAQVFEIQRRLPQARVGTVDKFQGQEAPIAIYSMATSSHADAPRGMEFLYSANRFNVAVSRAKCLVILVASPKVFETECRTPRQMQLANAFCRYLELGEAVSL